MNFNSKRQLWAKTPVKRGFRSHEKLVRATSDLDNNDRMVLLNICIWCIKF